MSASITSAIAMSNVMAGTAVECMKRRTLRYDSRLGAWLDDDDCFDMRVNSKLAGFSRLGVLQRVSVYHKIVRAVQSHFSGKLINMVFHGVGSGLQIRSAMTDGGCNGVS